MARRRRTGKSRKGFIVLAAVLGVILVTVAVLLSPLFRIKTVEIDPMENYSKGEIFEYLKDLEGVNGFKAVMQNSSLSQSRSLFSLELVDLEDQIRFDCPYIESITVKYSPRSTVKVSCVERGASFLTESSGMFLMCDSHGIALESFTAENKPEGLPLVKGINLTAYKLGRSISDGKNENIDCAIKISGLLSQLSMESYIDIIDVSDYNNIYLFCAPSLTVELGNIRNIGVRLALLKGIMDKEGGLNGNSDGVLTLLDGRQATFVKSSDLEQDN